MRNLIFTIIIVCSFSKSNDLLANESFITTSATAIIKTEINKDLKKDNAELMKLVEKRVSFFSTYMTLSRYQVKRLRSILMTYSTRADKVMQSSIDVKTKSRELMHLVDQQTKEFKEIFTVHQYYKFVELSNSIKK